MDFLRVVIMEKCEVKDIEIGQIMTMATRVDILENYFTDGQHNIFVFQQFTSNFEHKKVASVALMLFFLCFFTHRLSGFRVRVVNCVVVLVVVFVRMGQVVALAASFVCRH